MLEGRPKRPNETLLDVDLSVRLPPRLPSAGLPLAAAGLGTSAVAEAPGRSLRRAPFPRFRAISRDLALVRSGPVSPRPLAAGAAAVDSVRRCYGPRSSGGKRGWESRGVGPAVPLSRSGLRTFAGVCRAGFGSARSAHAGHAGNAGHAGHGRPRRPRRQRRRQQRQSQQHPQPALESWTRPSDAEIVFAGDAMRQERWKR